MNYLYTLIHNAVECMKGKKNSSTSSFLEKYAMNKLKNIALSNHLPTQNPVLRRASLPFSIINDVFGPKIVAI